MWKNFHHFIPMLSESLLKQQINRIFSPVIFIFFYHGGFIGCVREILLKRYKLKTQLSILKPRRGHALKNDQEQPCSDTTDPDYFWHKMRVEI
jgi:hypothetical protein